jgi:hypothetical protein
MTYSDELLMKIMHDPGNLDKHLLDPEQQRVVDGIFSELEQEILEGKKSDPKLPNHPMARLSQVFGENVDYRYRLYVANWVAMKLSEVSEHAFLQLSVKQFYEMKCEVPYGTYPVKCALVNEPRYANFKSFTREGNEFYFQTFEIDARIIQRNGVYSGGISPKVSDSPIEPWSGDFRRLTDRIIEECADGYSTILFDTSVKLPEEFHQGVVLATFFPQYIEYKDRKERSRGWVER